MAMASLGAGRIRAFLALPLAEAFGTEVTPFIEKWKREFPGVRWVNPLEIHLTLHFFGSIEKESVGRLSSLVHPLAQKTVPFEIFLRGMGAFPSLGRPRVFWIGVEGGLEPLKTLQVGLRGALTREGYPVEERAFGPHLTVGRLRSIWRPRHAIRLDFPHSQLRRMDRVVLFQSQLTPDGPHYETIKTFPFSASS